MEFLSSHADVVSYGGSLLLKAAAILALTWVISFVLRSRSAGLRHLLWSAALGAVLALPLISAWVPPIEVDVSSLERVSERFFSPAQERERRVVEMLSGSAPFGQELQQLRVSDGEAAVGRHATPAPAANAAALALAVWLVGVVALSLLFLVHVARIRRATRQAVSKSYLRALTDDVAAELELARRPRVMVGQVDMPVTWGLLRPVVLLPVEATEWDDGRLRIVLMHELAHIRRFDYLPHLLAELTSIVYWPNPLVWIARHRLRAEQELACDDVVLRTGTASHAYAELLLDIARSVQGRRLFPGGVRMAERVGLKARIQAILDPSVERGTVSVVAFAVVLLAVVVPALSTAALRSAETDTDSAEASAASPEAAATSPDRTEASRSGDAASDMDPVSDGPAVFALTVEAESGSLADPMKVREDDRASGGGYVEVPDQKGHDPPEGGPGRVSFQIDARASGARAVWARAIGEYDNDNSFFVSVDGGEELRWDIVDPRGRDEVKRWTWLLVTDRAGDPLRLEPGVRTLTFRNREDGSRLDAVFVTSDPDLVPRGRSPLPPPETSISVGMEAEATAEIAAPLEIRADSDASGGLYLSAADRHESRRRPPKDGRASYHVDVPEAGAYVLWARAMGPSDDEDSFWIRVNDSEWIRWNEIEDDDDWEWQLVHDSDDDDEIAVFPLRAGSNTLEVAYREDGARIDRIVVTNNMYVHPSAPTDRESDVTVTFSD
jgi:beta-lactamase regulating signal transducer with metallopeptidase domain